MLWWPSESMYTLFVSDSRRGLVMWVVDRKTTVTAMKAEHLSTYISLQTRASAIPHSLLRSITSTWSPPRPRRVPGHLNTSVSQSQEGSSRLLKSYGRRVMTYGGRIRSFIYCSSELTRSNEGFRSAPCVITPRLLHRA